MWEASPRGCTWTPLSPVTRKEDYFKKNNKEYLLFSGHCVCQGLHSVIRLDFSLALVLLRGKAGSL